jgi:hypothetical protein
MHEEGKEEAADENEDDSVEEVEEVVEDESDPGEQIVDFDWTDLQERYHRAIQGCERNEAQLMEEFDSLMSVLR